MEAARLVREPRSTQCAPAPNTMEILRGAQIKRRPMERPNVKRPGPLKADHNLRPLSAPSCRRPVDSEVAMWNTRGARPKRFPSLDKENQQQQRQPRLLPSVPTKRRDSPSQRVRFEDENSDSSSQRSTPRSTSSSSQSDVSRKAKSPRCLDAGEITQKSKRSRTVDIPTQAEFENGIEKHRATPVLAVPTPDVEKAKYADQLRRQWTKFEQQTVKSRPSSEGMTLRSASVPSLVKSEGGFVNPVTDKLLKTKLKRAPAQPRGPVVADHNACAATEEKSSEDQIVKTDSETESQNVQSSENSSVSKESSSEQSNGVNRLIQDFSQKPTYLPNGAINTYSFSPPGRNTAEAPASRRIETQSVEDEETPKTTGESRLSLREKSASAENVNTQSVSSPPRHVRSSSECNVSTPQHCVIKDFELQYDSPDRRTSGCFSNLQSTKKLSSSRTSIGEKMDNIKSSVKKKITSLRRAMSVDAIDRKSKHSIEFVEDGSVKVKKAPSVQSLFKKKHKRTGSVDTQRIKALTEAASQNIPKSDSHTSLNSTFTISPDSDKTTSSTSVDNPRNFRPIGTLKGLNSDGTQVVQLQKPPHGPFGFYVSRGTGKLKNHIFVSRMSDGYPEKFYAGLLSVGDEILEINNKQAKKMSVDEIYDMMAGNDTLLLKNLPLLSRDLYTKK